MKMKRKTGVIIGICVCVAVMVIGIIYINRKDRDVTDIGAVSQGVNVQSGAVVTDKLIYFVSAETSHIMVYDRSNGVCGELCNKPECKHDSDSCNAFVNNAPTSASTLSYYDDFLYYIELNGSKVELKKQTVDGSNKETVTQLYEFVEEGESDFSLRSLSLKVYGGYAYFVADEINPLMGISEKSSILKINLENGEKKEFVSLEGKNIGIDILQITDNTVDYMVTEFDEAMEKIYSSIMSCNIDNGKEETLLNKIEGMNSATIVDNKIYYKVMYENVYAYDIESNETKCIIECVEEKDKLETICSDGRYLYIDNIQSSYLYDIEEENICVRIYDFEGEYINQFKLLDSSEILGYRVIDESAILYFVNVGFNTSVRYVETKDIEIDTDINWRVLYEVKN